MSENDSVKLVTGGNSGRGETPLQRNNNLREDVK